MPDMYIILGEGNSRKSSTFRALTGAARERFWNVMVNNHDRRFYVFVSSLQEAEITVADFLRRFPNNEALPDVILTLRMDALRKNGVPFPDGSVYIDAFIRRGWRIRGIACLGVVALPYVLNARVPRPRFIQGSRNMPSNSIAAQLRHTWHFA